MMKLKINTKTASLSNLPTPSSIETQSGSHVKLKLKPPNPSATVAEPLPKKEPIKNKRKYVKKKKDGTHDEGDTPSKKGDVGESDKAPLANRHVANSITTASPLSTPYRTTKGSITIKNRQTIAPRQITVKHRGRPLPRPIGVGYDSEAEDVEEDPAIESQIILRMVPGKDCDYLRKAIEDKKIGLPIKDGGADFTIRFLDREGRRATVSILGRLYTAVLVDLPCVIEGMKSWDRRNWWKSADICQMLLVTDHAPSEDAAKAAPLPREIDSVTCQYPHGLTPPMHYVRKRRFRKRVSHRTIEAVEEEVERLIRLDETARADGGSTEFEIMDLDSFRGTNSRPDSDADGIYDDDEAAMAQLMEQELGQASDDELTFSRSAPTPDSVVLNVSRSENSNIASLSPSIGAETGEEEEESDSDAHDADENELSRQQELAQQREEVADLEKEIQIAKAQLEKQSNMLLRQRLVAKVMSLHSDLDLKKAGLSEENN